MSLRASLAAALLLLTAGCSLAPDFQRPEPPVPAAFPYAEARLAGGQGAVEGAAQRSAAEISWWDFYGDARLRGLISLALENNRDLRQTALNVESARARFRIQRAEQLPQLDAQAQATRQRVPESLAGAGGTGAGVYDDYFVGLGISAYELDLFGRVRSLRDAALAEFLATEAAQRGAQLSLVAAVATAYLNERAAEERLAIIDRSLETRQESLRLARLRFDAGVGDELSLRDAQTLLSTARADRARAVRERAQAHNALQLLIGQVPPEDLPPPRPLDGQALIADVPAGLPAELIARRPDVLAAEQRLRSANASIGAARAAFFPSISLTGRFGSASTELDELFDDGTRSWSFVPQISLPIFAAGRNRANLDLAQLRTDAAVADYEKTIQTGFREVADGLAARATLDEELAAQQDLLAAAQRRFELSELRFNRGVDNELQRLDAHRLLYDAQLALLQTRLLRLTSLVDLYRALGGGWRPAPQTPAPD